ncbi:hypothetical protein PS2_033814 [Malus domestica]
MDIDTLDPNNILLKLQNNLDLVDAKGGVCMVAFISADKPPNRGASVGLLKKAWTHLGEVRVSTKSDTAFAITVPDQLTASKILEGGPWNVAGFCCTAQLWPKDLAFEEIPPHRVVYWVQLHGVPLGQYSMENAKSIGEAYGEVLQVEDPFNCPDGVRGFLRIRLQLDARKPIPSRCWLARAEGKPSRVEFYYESQRSHILCFNCGRLGHINSSCWFAPDPHPEIGNRYGGWTFVNPIRQARDLMMTAPRPPINKDEGNRRWTAGARGESLSLTPFPSRQDRTLEPFQAGGGNVTSLQAKPTSLSEDASSSNLPALNARHPPASMVNAVVETPNTELSLQLSPSHSLQQNFLFLSHPTPYFPRENPFNTTNHPWPTYQPKNNLISILIDPLPEPNFESPSPNTSTVSKPKDGPFFPGMKPLQLKYSQMGGIVLNPLDPESSNITLGKKKAIISVSEVSLQPHKKYKTTCAPSQATKGGSQGLRDKAYNRSLAKARGHGLKDTGHYDSPAARRMVTRSQQEEQRVAVQFNKAKKIILDKETSEYITLEGGIGGPIPIEAEEVPDKDATDPDNPPGGGGWPRTATGQP